MATLEANADGSFDVSEAEEVNERQRQSEEWKAKGKQAFLKKQYQEAQHAYTKALEMDPKSHLLYANRSACCWHLKEFEQALRDAETTIELRASWAKGYYRKAMALSSLNKYKEAESSFRTAAEYAPEDKTLLANARKMRQLREKQRGPTEKMRGFFSKATKSIYDDQHDVIVDEVNSSGTTKNSLLLLRKLKRGVSSKANEVCLDGIFAKLLDPVEFRKIIYPGIPQDKLDTLPKDFEELLNDSEYEEELEKIIPQVEAKAHAVLSNVKAKGAAKGDIMDAETEKALMPQVLKEAFGREVIKMINKVNARKHAAHAKKSFNIASPKDERAKLNQLEGVSVRDLTCPSKGFIIKDSFMGEDWIPLLLEDCERMRKFGKLEQAYNDKSVGYMTGLLAFVEQSDCEEKYPAISELIEKLHSLPFELNHLLNLGLNVACTGSTAVSLLREGEQLQMHLDGGTGARDNGRKLTCVYFLNEFWKEANGGKLQLQTPSSSEQSIEPIADRLVIFRSRDISNAILEVQNNYHCYLTFWIHGKDNAEDLD